MCIYIRLVLWLRNHGDSWDYTLIKTYLCILCSTSAKAVPLDDGPFSTPHPPAKVSVWLLIRISPFKEELESVFSHSDLYEQKI